MARKFPSPLGASYFQIKKNTTNKNSRRVSVPSRGILFPNAISARLASRIFLVSVPSRGILFPNGGLPYIRIFSKRFRPLSGHLISKWTMNFMPLK